MKLTDLRVLMQGGKLPKKEAAIRAAAFAGLIEEFCRVSVPEAFGETGEEPAGKFAVAERMATAIVEIMKKQGGCLPHDLAAKGFTYEEIDRHWAMAKALAHVELKITDA